MRACTALALSVAVSSALAAPHLLSRQDDSESGAFSLQSFEDGAKQVFGDVTSAVSTVAPIISGVSDVADLFARDDDTEFLARELYEARQDSDDSGALSLQSFEDGAKKVFGDVSSVVSTVAPIISGVSDVADLFARDDAELLARELHEARQDSDDSGALSLQSFEDGAKKVFGDVSSVVSTVAPIISGVSDVADLFARDDADLLARALYEARQDSDDSGALSLQSFENGAKEVFGDVSSVVSTVAPIISGASKLADLFARAALVDSSAFTKRDELKLLAREELLRRADASSGALSLQDVEDFGEGFVKGFTGTLEAVAPIAAAFAKREELELLRRADASSSGALSLQDVEDFGEGFVKGFTGTLEAVAPLAAAFAKREELELLARSALLEVYSKRSLVDLD